MAQFPAVTVVHAFPKGAPPYQINDIQISAGDDLRILIFRVDDDYVLYLNGQIVSSGGINSPPVNLSLKRLLTQGQNILRFVVINHNLLGPNYWSAGYEIGIFDANDQPKYPAIHIDETHQDGGGVKYDVSYAFFKT